MSETTTKATPRPWEQEVHGHFRRICGDAIREERIRTMTVVADVHGNATSQETTKANAELIVRAVNVHDDLLAALIAARDHLNYCNYGDQWENECARDEKLPEKISAALAKAGAP
jgi:hypothetical protein